jgi:hypothetical protein
MLSICQAGANCRTGPSGYIQLHPSAAAATVTTTSQSSFTNRFLRAPVTSLCSSKQACKRTWVHRRASDEVDSNTVSESGLQAREHARLSHGYMLGQQ